MADVNGAVAPVVDGRSDGGAVTGLAGRLPEVPEPRAAVLQALFRQPRRWAVEGGGVLEFAPSDAPSPAETFAIESDGARLAIAFDPQGGAMPEGLHWGDHVGRSRVLAWSLAHEARLVHSSQAFGMTLVPVVGGGDEPVAEATAGEGTWLRFRVGAHGTTGAAGVAWLPLPRLRALLARAEPVDEVRAAKALARWRDLPVPVAVSMAGPRVPQSEWSGMSPGAVIVAGRVSNPPPVRARGAGRGWPVEAAPDGWRVEGPGVPDSNDQEKTMSEDEQQAAQDTDAGEGTASTRVGELPVQVQFELGRLEVALEDLAQLQPGYVFALPAHLQGTNVAIRANGREVGRGELVAIGDTLGVRLLAWS